LRGAEALRRLWDSAETLPRPDELEAPERWVERVMSDAPAA
jgi:uncharacterized protein (DUF2342 family)